MKTVEQFCIENNIKYDSISLGDNNDNLMDFCNENNIDYVGDVMNDYYEFDETLIELCLNGTIKPTRIYNVPVKDVAFALALRIIDEWDGFDDNKPLLQNALETMLKDNPKICESLWDNGIIEADYFVELD